MRQCERGRGLDHDQLELNQLKLMNVIVIKNVERDRTENR
jgi:hypothetical protein